MFSGAPMPSPCQGRWPDGNVLKGSGCGVGPQGGTEAKAFSIPSCLGKSGVCASGRREGKREGGRDAPHVHK